MLNSSLVKLNGRGWLGDYVADFGTIKAKINVADFGTIKAKINVADFGGWLGDYYSDWVHT